MSAIPVDQWGPSPLRLAYRLWQRMKLHDAIEEAYYRLRYPAPANDADEARERVAEAMGLDTWRDLGGEA